LSASEQIDVDTVTVNGATFAMRAIGAGPTVLVPKAWACDEYAVLARDYRLVMYDPRGRGQSPAVPMTELSFDQDVKDLEAIREAIGASTISVIGWSYFGAVAARYAMVYPHRVTRLVLVGSKGVRDDLQAIRAAQVERLRQRVPHLMRHLREDVTPTAAELRALTLAMVMTRCGRRPPWPGGRDRAFMGTFAQASGSPHTYYSTHRHLGKTMGAWDWREDAQRITAATLVIYGASDLLAHAACQEWTRAIPVSRGLLLDGVGHFPSLEDPDRFFPPVTGFLAGEWPAAAAAAIDAVPAATRTSAAPADRPEAVSGGESRC
jgi:pimeloyl-ACP methyl ester carboxylesterase